MGPRGREGLGRFHRLAPLVAVQNPKTARELPQLCGEHGVLATSEGDTRGTSIRWGDATSASSGKSANRSEIRRPLIKPDKPLQDARADEALTRQRASATIFAATETVRDVAQLAQQMARGEIRSASVAWATRDELAPELRAAAETRAARRATARRAATQAPAAVGEAAPGWLIALAEPSPPLARGAVAAAVAASLAVQHERAALELYRKGTYRDPETARVRLDELVTSQGATSAARRVDADPT